MRIPVNLPQNIHNFLCIHYKLFLHTLYMWKCIPKSFVLEKKNSGNQTQQSTLKKYNCFANAQCNFKQSQITVKKNNVIPS